jgi:hypothetical protein
LHKLWRQQICGIFQAASSSIIDCGIQMLILGLGLSWVSTEKSLWVCTNRSESLFLILRWENWTYQERMNNFPVTGKRILRFWELWDSENDQFETLSLRQDLCFFPCYLTKTKLYTHVTCWPQIEIACCYRAQVGLEHQRLHELSTRIQATQVHRVLHCFTPHHSSSLIL